MIPATPTNLRRTTADKVTLGDYIEYATLNGCERDVELAGTVTNLDPSEDSLRITVQGGGVTDVPSAQPDRGRPMTCARCNKPHTKIIRGLCPSCYRTRRLQGHFDALAAVTTSWCGRCGVRASNDLCRDCISVTSDLGELAAWVA